MFFLPHLEPHPGSHIENPNLCPWEGLSRAGLLSPTLGPTGSSRLTPTVPRATLALPDPLLAMEKGKDTGGARAGTSPSVRDGEGAGWWKAENVTHLVSHRGSQEERFRKRTHPPIASVRTSSPIPLTSQTPRQGGGGGVEQREWGQWKVK